MNRRQTIKLGVLAGAAFLAVTFANAAAKLWNWPRRVRQSYQADPDGWLLYGFAALCLGILAAVYGVCLSAVPPDRETPSLPQVERAPNPHLVGQ